MPTDHVLSTHTAQDAAQDATIALTSPRLDVARPVSATNPDADKGLLAQLSNNPFFTAVRLLTPALEAGY